MSDSTSTSGPTITRIPAEKEPAVKTALARWALRVLNQRQRDKTEGLDETDPGSAR
jgi:hypothetical protein